MNAWHLAVPLLFAPPPASTGPSHPLEPSGAVAGITAVAEIPSKSLEVGEEYEVVVTVEFDGEIAQQFPWEEGYDRSMAYRPLLQLDVPPCMELVGSPPAQMETPLDFQQTYQKLPMGRRMMEKEERIAFRLLEKPDPKDRLGINLVYYGGPIDADDAETSTFERLRMDLKPKGGSRAKAKPSKVSSWTTNTLQIGDTLRDLELPDYQGNPQSVHGMIEDYLLVIVYRGEW